MAEFFDDQTRLVFLTNGYTAEHTVGGEAFDVRDATVDIKAKTKYYLDVQKGADMRHVALYAVFLSLTKSGLILLRRPNTEVTAMNARVVRPMTASAEQEAVVLQRFQTIEGADDISQLQKVSIGLIAARQFESLEFFTAQ